MTTEPTTAKRTRGPARPAKPRTVQLTVHLDPDTHDRLTRAADERVVSPSLLAGKAIEALVDRLVPLTQLLDPIAYNPTAGSAADAGQDAS